MATKHHLLLVAAILHTASCAPETVFAPMGNSVTLIMNTFDIVDKDCAVWIFNQTDIVTYYPYHSEDRQLRVSPTYESRVEFDTRDLSMELRNLQKSDSGLYTGEIKTPEDKTVVEYKLLVLESVQKPILTVIPVPDSWSSGGLCNMTVTCRAGDLSLTSTCNSSTCTQDGDSAHGGLTIFIKHGSIICNHSNPVSWSHAAEQTEGFCSPTQHLESPIDEQTTVTICIAVVGVIVLLAALIGVILGFLMKQERCASTVNQEVEMSSAEVVHTKSPLLSSVQKRNPTNVQNGTASPLTMASAPESVFAQEGNSITLIMNRHNTVDMDEVIWNLESGSKTDIVTYYPHHQLEDRRLNVWSSYKSRVEFDTTDLSMELRNLQKSDSGLYRGVIKVNNSKTVTEYNLLVLETVQKPNITTYADWSSGGLCKLAVTCRAGDLSLTSTCNSSTCTQDGDSAHGGLTIFIKHGSIICNHSNPVSWSHAAEQTEGLCSPTQRKEHQCRPADSVDLESPIDEQTTVTICIAVVGVIVLLAALIGVILGFRMHLKKQECCAANVYHEVKFSCPSPSEAEMWTPIEQQSSSASVKVVFPQNAMARSPDGNPPIIYSKIQPQTGPFTEHPPTIYSKIQPHTGPSTEHPPTIYSKIQPHTAPSTEHPPLIYSKIQPHTGPSTEHPQPEHVLLSALDRANCTGHLKAFKKHE
ncbi:hypothetical protein ACEWY4_006119 [Coilia grayii]|uniref:Immunoglobulin domain-containing protein n=1 Tax=Coilia grayii TaxID=363190 RepID=A0ABD1KCL7_9TELE